MNCSYSFSTADRQPKRCCRIHTYNMGILWQEVERTKNRLPIPSQESHQVARTSTFSDAGGFDKEPGSALYPVISNSPGMLHKLWILPEQTPANHFLACKTQGWHSKFAFSSAFSTCFLGPSSHWHATGVQEELETRDSAAAAPPGSLNKGKTAFAQCMGSDIIKLASQEQKVYIRKETGTRASPYKANSRTFLEQNLCLKSSHKVPHGRFRPFSSAGRKTVLGLEW